MHILLTNDDGVSAKGIMVLYKALSKIAKVTVLAPDRNCSGVSSAISIDTPLRVTETSTGFWQLNGNPADCVKLALSDWLEERPDIVISGINRGANLADDVVYSGTVAAAIEGRFLGMPSIAVSSIGKVDPHYETAAKVTVDLVQRLEKFPIENEMILNVNVPDMPLSELKGVQVTRLGERHMSEPVAITTDNRGRDIYWVGEAGRVRDGGEGTDFHAVSTGYASVTPVQVDMTDHRRLNTIQDWMTY